MAFSVHLQKILQNIGMSPRDRAVEESFKGLNITGRNNALPANTENHGYTFFTRPCLNLSYGNCMIDRRLSMLQNPNPLSIERNIRAYLDPKEHQKQPSSWCPGVDPLNPFITLLSNNLISLTGWEDFTLNYSTTPAGVYRDAMSYVDDVPYQYGTYDLQATMRNINGDPITWMLYIWEVYAGLGREGRILPYPELLILKEYDYNTRIYRLVMDATKTYITRLAACGAAAPLNAPTGQILNFTGDGSESPFQTTNEQLNFSFRCSGLTTYDHILIYEFNDLVETFNPMMREGRRGVATRKLAPNEREYFNFQSYPYINGMTMELEWHVPLDIYNKEIGGKYTPR